MFRVNLKIPEQHQCPNYNITRILCKNIGTVALFYISLVIKISRLKGSWF